jgi:hypothetical protein
LGENKGDKGRLVRTREKYLNISPQIYLDALLGNEERWEKRQRVQLKFK